MPGKPIESYVESQIEQQGGWDVILSRLASGETVADVARTLYRPDHKAIDRSTLSHMLHRTPERSAATKAAQLEGASAMVDHALTLVDTAQVDRDSTNNAKVRAELRLKIAGLKDRDQWGERPAMVNVQVNVESLHIDALRHRLAGSALPEPVEVQALPTETSPNGSDGHGSHARDTQDASNSQDARPAE